MTDPLGISKRLKRPNGRASRTKILNVRLTEEEHARVVKLAHSAELFPGEWARATLLAKQEPKRSTAPVPDAASRAIFTELLLLRGIVERLLPPLVIGQKLTEETVRDIFAELRADKHEQGRKALAIYTNPLGDPE